MEDPVLGEEGDGRVLHGSPLFSRACLKLENGKTIEISARGNSAENVYVDRVKVNGKVRNANFIKISTLQKGARIEFRMSDKPNTGRGIYPEDYPYSLTADK